MKGNKRDANHAEIVSVLRQCGAYVKDVTDMPGFGADLVVGYRGRWMLMEIKDSAKPPSARKLTATEQAVRADAERVGAPYLVVSSVNSAVHAIEAN